MAVAVDAPTSAREAAVRRLDEQSPLVKPPLLRRLGKPGSAVALRWAVAYLFLLVAAAWAARVAAPVASPGFAPRNPSSVLGTMWQVQASMSALGFPLLLLLLEFTRSQEMLARGSAEVLAQESFIVPGILVSAVGVVVEGAASAWLGGDAVVVVLFAGAFCPALGLLLWSYTRALFLMFEPQSLRDRSAQLLKERLALSVREAYLVALANQIVLEALGDLAKTQWSPEHWDDVPSTSGGTIVDIDVLELSRALQDLGRLPLPAVEVAESDPQPVPTGLSPGVPVARLIRLCGEGVKPGQPLLQLNPALDPALKQRFLGRIQRAYVVSR